MTTKIDNPNVTTTGKTLEGSGIRGGRSHGSRFRAWLDRVLQIRDKVLSSERFQRRIAALPFARPIIRSHERALFDLCAGFVYSQVLFACVKLDLFRILLESPQSEAALAQRFSLSPDAIRRLLLAAVSLGLVSRRGANYGLSPLGAAAAGNPAVAAMIEHHAHLYADLADPVALLRGPSGGGSLARYWAYARNSDAARLDAEDVAGYSSLMADSQRAICDEILRAYPVRRHACLMDVGGGDGIFLTEAARRAPGLKLRLFDLPAVIDRAAARFAEAGLSHRIETYGGSFLADPLPAGADLVTLIRVLLDHDDDAARAILQSVRTAMPDGGVLLVAEPMAGVPGAEPVAPYFGLYLLAMGSGRPRTPAELTGLLAEAGFGRIRFVRTGRPLLASLLITHTEVKI